jgi:hypothetical protein
MYPQLAVQVKRRGRKKLRPRSPGEDVGVIILACTIGNRSPCLQMDDDTDATVPMMVMVIPTAMIVSPAAIIARPPAVVARHPVPMVIVMAAGVIACNPRPNTYRMNRRRIHGLGDCHSAHHHQGAETNQHDFYISHLCPPLGRSSQTRFIHYRCKLNVAFGRNRRRSRRRPNRVAYDKQPRPRSREEIVGVVLFKPTLSKAGYVVHCRCLSL